MWSEVMTIRWYHASSPPPLLVLYFNIMAIYLKPLEDFLFEEKGVKNTSHAPRSVYIELFLEKGWWGRGENRFFFLSEDKGPWESLSLMLLIIIFFMLLSFFRSIPNLNIHKQFSTLLIPEREISFYLLLSSSFQFEFDSSSRRKSILFWRLEWIECSERRGGMEGEAYVWNSLVFTQKDHKMQMHIRFTGV